MKIKAFAVTRTQKRFSSCPPLIGAKGSYNAFKGRAFKKTKAKNALFPKYLILFFFILCLPFSAAKAQGLSEEKKAQKLEEQAQKNASEAQKLEGVANRTMADLNDLRDQLIKAARSIQNQEANLTNTETTLATLEKEESVKSAALYHNRQRLSRVLSALQRIALQPPEALVVAPGDPLDMVRSAILLDSAVPTIKDDVAKLKRDLDAMADIRLRIRDERASQITVRKKLKQQQEFLERLVKEKKRHQKKQLADIKDRRRRAQKFEREARSLRELIHKLHIEEEKRQKIQQKEPPTLPLRPEKRPPKPTERKQVAFLPLKPSHLLLRPARGRITKAFGQKKDDNAALKKGIIITTRPQAQIIAPFDGKVVYAGSFRGYGKLIILEHREKNQKGEYHSLIAGLKEITVIEDQRVLSGEPIAKMQSDKNRQPEVYFELRKDGQAVNPLPWFKSR